MRSLVILALLAIGSSNADAAIIISFDELSTQPANGVLINGVLIGYTVGGNPSPDAIYNDLLPVGTTYLDDHVLTGSPLGLLSFQFAVAATSFQFGLVMNTLDALQPGAQVQVFDSTLQSLGVFPFDTNPLVLFTEGLFTYSGPAASRVEITFASSTADIFAVDNLQYDTGVPDDTSVPEPGTWLLTGAGILTALAARRITLQRS